MEKIIFALSLLFTTWAYATPSSLPTECIPCPPRMNWPSCQVALSPYCQEQVRREVERLRTEAQQAERRTIPTTCRNSEPIVVPPVIASFDPFAVAISNQIQNVSERCRKARNTFEEWLRTRNEELDRDWDNRLNSRIMAERMAAQNYQAYQGYQSPPMNLSQGAMMYCSQFVDPDQNAACLFQVISGFQGAPNQAPQGYIPMPIQGTGQ